MRELRALGALILAGIGWWAAITVPARFEVGAWYVLLAITLFLVGPFVIAALVSFPRFRGSEMKLPAIVAGAGGPFLVWLIALDWETPDKTPQKLLAIPLFLVLALVGALLGWALAATVEATQDQEYTR